MLGMQAVVAKLKLSFAFGGFFLPEGSPGSFQPPFTHSSHVVGRAFAVLFAFVPGGLPGSGDTESRSEAPVSLMAAAPDSVAKRQRAQVHVP